MKTGLFKKIAIFCILILAFTMSITDTIQAKRKKAPKVATELKQDDIIKKLKKSGGTVFPIGTPNTGYAKYFTGKSYLAPLSADEDISISNVTFEPNCINHWHIHHKYCQILVGVSGKGLYQIEGQPIRTIEPGDTITIPAGTKHWHGATEKSWFQHLSIMKKGTKTTWLEPVHKNEVQPTQESTQEPVNEEKKEEGENNDKDNQ